MYAAIRVRGNVGVNKNLKYAMEALRLHRVNHLILLDETKPNRGMLKKAEQYITYGEIDEATLTMLVSKRGRTAGNRRIDDEFLKKAGFRGAAEIAAAIINSKKKLHELGIKPVFRLTPPKKGHKRAGIKKSYRIGGAAGYRAADINKLILKMI